MGDQLGVNPRLENLKKFIRFGGWRLPQGGNVFETIVSGACDSHIFLSFKEVKLEALNRARVYFTGEML